MDLRVLVRDLQTREWSVENPMSWVEEHREVLAEAPAIHLETCRGSLQIAGSAGEGPISVCAAETHEVVADLCWQTMTADELAAAGVAV
jgi:hypothetical protein